MEDALRRTLTGAWEEYPSGIGTEASTLVESYLDIEYHEQTTSIELRVATGYLTASRPCEAVWVAGSAGARSVCLQAPVVSIVVGDPTARSS